MLSARLVDIFLVARARILEPDLDYALAQAGYVRDPGETNILNRVKNKSKTKF